MKNWWREKWNIRAELGSSPSLICKKPWERAKFMVKYWTKFKINTHKSCDKKQKINCFYLNFFESFVTKTSYFLIRLKLKFLCIPVPPSCTAVFHEKYFFVLFRNFISGKMASNIKAKSKLAFKLFQMHLPANVRPLFNLCKFDINRLPVPLQHSHLVIFTVFTSVVFV